MAGEKKFLGVGGIVLIVMILGTVVAGWYFTRTKPEDLNPTVTTDEVLDVICFGRVDVQTRVTNLETEVPGKVIAVFVKDGESVKKGQKILQVDATPYMSRLKEAEAAKKGSDVEVALAEQEAERFTKQLELRKQSVAIATARVEEAERSVKLVQEQQTGMTNNKSAKLELEIAQGRLKQVQIAQAAEQTTVDLFAKSDPQLAVRAAKARLQAVEAALEIAIRAVADCTLLAPGDGTILRLNVAVGGAIAPGTPMPFVIFAPAGPLVVRGELEQEYLGRVQAGQIVEIRDEARADSPMWTGKVVEVSKWVAQRRSMLMEPGELNDVRTAECVVEFDKQPEPLFIGQRMRVRVKGKK